MKKHCKPCEEGAEKLSAEEVGLLHQEVPEWTLSRDGTQLIRAFPFKDFASALSFANNVGVIAETEWHHPDMLIGWGKVEITLMTHSIRGLSENDFIIAKKIDELQG